jgi:hypothetical protein
VSRSALVYEKEPSLDGGHTSLHVGLAQPFFGSSNSFLQFGGSHLTLQEGSDLTHSSHDLSG